MLPTRPRPMLEPNSMQRQEPPKDSVEQGSGSPCSHHWVIAPAEGPISLGVCKKCDLVRQFKNSIEWGDGRESSRSTSSAGV